MKGSLSSAVFGGLLEEFCIICLSATETLLGGGLGTGNWVSESGGRKTFKALGLVGGLMACEAQGFTWISPEGGCGVQAGTWGENMPSPSH